MKLTANVALVRQFSAIKSVPLLDNVSLRKCLRYNIFEMKIFIKIAIMGQNYGENRRVVCF